ncbi:MAG TPA: endolytic transglycosylase MltG [Verrucomicrobiae bacterium]|nr:endolytic transglycosylase MltG [Verrucomicrobiae bacterium]
MALKFAKKRPAEPSLSLKRSRKRLWLGLVIGLLAVLIAGIVVCALWYQQALQPRDPAANEKTVFTVKTGETAEVIGDNLETKGFIKSSFAFQLYAQFAKVKHKLQAGTYSLSPAQSVADIIKKLTSGDTDQFMITILPGSTLKDIKKTLETAGFSADEIDQALNASYQHPLLAGKPAQATLEGYIFPDSYLLESGQSASSLLQRTFDTFYQKLQTEKLLPEFEKRQLTLYQAITLGSIIQKEVGEADASQVAQVFYSRLEKDMPLGADATFIYAAELLGVEPRVTLDSPYNTREVKGLPPGPIGNMTIAMLKAVAYPADGDYLFFVSGDDGTNYFSRTEAEHEEYTRKYCIKNCSIFRN